MRKKQESNHILLEEGRNAVRRTRFWRPVLASVLAIAALGSAGAGAMDGPVIDAGAFIDVGPDKGGTLVLPGLPGFRFEVEPGAATFADGSKSGGLNVTFVNTEKMPMPPGNAMAPDTLVTVQPPGTRFDPPMAVSYPNVNGLAPGTIIDLFSFDHDLGNFLTVGTGTVSEDGTVITSDPGGGVIEAGWHCGEVAGVSGCLGTPTQTPLATFNQVGATVVFTAAPYGASPHSAMREMQRSRKTSSFPPMVPNSLPSAWSILEARRASTACRCHGSFRI